MRESGTATLGMMVAQVVPEKSEDHKNDEQDGNDQGDLDFVNGSANGRAAIDGDAQMQRGRDGGAQTGRSVS